MKRKTLDDYFTPIKKKKETIQCSDCGLEIYKLLAHKCQSRSFENPEKELPKVLKTIMQTSQTTLKSNFHLEYTGKSNGKHTWSYSFCDTRPHAYKSKGHKLKQSAKDTQEILLTFSTDHRGQPVHFFDIKPLPSFSPSILKSILQKGVRRGMRRQVLKTALQLGCNSGIQELARRLCVITLEDGFLHPDMPLLVWCMGVSDYEYSIEILESILQILNDLVCADYRDILIHYDDINVYKLWKQSDVLVKSILIRAFYKGMAGDVAMLQDYSLQWHHRLQNPAWVTILNKVYQDVPVLELKDLSGEYCMDDTVLQGIDFHCSNMLEWLLSQSEIMKELSQVFLGDLNQYLHDAIWNHRSKINSKKFISQMPDASSLCPAYIPEQTPEDPVFNKYVLPPIDIYSSAELRKRFKTKSTNS